MCNALILWVDRACWKSAVAFSVLFATRGQCLRRQSPQPSIRLGQSLQLSQSNAVDHLLRPRCHETASLLERSAVSPDGPGAAPRRAVLKHTPDSVSIQTERLLVQNERSLASPVWRLVVVDHGSSKPLEWPSCLVLRSHLRVPVELLTIRPTAPN